MDALPRKPLLERLCLHRPELRAWALYDWANSGLVTVIVTAVFPIYFSRVACEGMPGVVASRRFAAITTASLIAAALISPFLGAWADAAGAKKRLLAWMMALGVGATAALFAVQHGDWLLGGALFGLANVGVVGSFVLYDALLPHVAKPGELDRLSSAGYALGYVGGGLLLLLDLLLIQHPGWFGLPQGEGLSPAASTLPSRLAFVSVAVWWVVFSIPLFLRVSEPPALRPASAVRRGALRETARDLARTLRDLAGMRQTLLMLAAFLIYNDGIGTIIRLATTYGEELKLDAGAMIAAILMVQFVGVPCAFLFGALAGRIGSKRAILVGLGVYFVITLIAWRMDSEREFFVLAFLVGTVQGGVQALSRSLYASLVPSHRSGEFFGLFAVLEKFAGIAGPGLFVLASWLTDSSSIAILSVLLLFFAVGSILLTRVDVCAGQLAARAAEPRRHSQESASGAR
jgi:UMF1 family MFS transporter